MAVKSEPRVVALPVAVSRYESARELNEQAPASDLMNFDCVPDLAGLKILVVDDEPDACAFIARLLSECRAEVAMAHSAEEAWGTLNSQCVDVLVSDIGMPGVDGYSLMGRVRTVEGNEKLRSIPAVALTAFARPEDRRKAALAGFQVHLAKPIEAIEFLAVVASLAGRTGR
jgi:CheY-like chemotaxis protein